ncbi:HNH endonuclease signature motif containing protein [Streptomyces sp. S465]|uniref:HNH endonuclease signature motif containing protein n=1 Tax=Streptomyces sp. S465 TaxID=2979468 RepID=UPI002E348C8D|nr:HNH endonuclease signature motif containing protein [Streptomyces sp. S465]
MAMADITRREVEQAMAEFDRLERDPFLQHYGFRRARRYMVSHDGKLYDSKAIVGAAHGFLPGQQPLTWQQLSGGAKHAARLLRRLGFAVEEPGGAGPHEDLITRVTNLKVNRSSGQPALYQPITLLWAFGRARRGEARLLSWIETEDAIKALLERHGMRGERPRPDYPIAALHRAGLWELHGHTGSVPTARGDSKLRRWFAEHHPSGGLPEPVYHLVQHSAQTRLAAIDTLLSTFFQDLDYEPLLTEVGLYDDNVADDVLDADEQDDEGKGSLNLAAQYERWCRIVDNRENQNRGRRVPRTRYDPIRSGSARRAVLHRSQGRCENPNCSGQPTDVTDAGRPILEVDHVMDLALDGRDHPSQMVALCPNCHAVKTRGRTREQLRVTLLDVALERHTALRTAQEAE